MPNLSALSRLAILLCALFSFIYFVMYLITGFFDHRAVMGFCCGTVCALSSLKSINIVESKDEEI